MRTRIACFGFAAAVAWVTWSAVSSQAPPVVGDHGATALLVRFGVTDTTPTTWDGEVAAAAGEVVSVRSWRPRAGESVDGVRSWKLASAWTEAFQNRAWEAEPLRPPRRELRVPGLVVHVRGAAARLEFTTPHGKFTVRTADVQPGNPVRALGGRILVQRVPAAVQVSETSHESESAALARGAGDDLWVAWVGYRKGASEVLARRFDGRAWGAVQAVSPRPGDIFHVKLVQGGGTVWAIWTEQVNGNWDLYGRRFDGRSWSAVERLSDHPQPDIHHAVASGANGEIWLAWQGFRDGQSDIFARRFAGSSWSPAERLSTSPANDWSPAITAGPSGRAYVAWDTYDKGNYDVVFRAFDGSVWSATQAIASTPNFEAKVTLACDREGRVWAAWNESGSNWGKDTGLLVRRQATPLYEHRLIATAVLADGGWQRPAADLEASLPTELSDRNESFALSVDAAGRMWLFFRHRVDRIPDVPIEAALHGAAWELWASAYEGSAWSTPVPVPSSAGRSDMTTAIAADSKGNLHLAWATDGRDYETMIHRKAGVFTGAFPASTSSVQPPQFVAATEAKLRTFEPHPREAEDLARIRGYTIQSEGKTYRIYRGDIHRHTEISRDGKQDGSLWDTYRYALDAASLDFLGVSDHNTQGGPDVEYINWINQQAADIFLVSGRFAPLFGYERSLSYPNGHRNVMFARRGIPTLPIPPEEAKAQTGAKALYEYLRKNRGIAVSHTSATGMGTDWRDNDPEVEPLVEIYQGDRVSAEHEGAPKAASAGDPTSQAGGFRPLGYVWNAWAKGYKLGVQASSDHLSTHISYACTIAEDFSREGLIEAMRRRHSYGATDNIVLDYRIRAGGREYIQGDIADVKGPFQLWVKILGTAPVRQVDIIRSNRYIHNLQNLGREVDFTFADNEPLPGESYYYIRVMQVDEQMAWSSPIWVRR
jgi:hypothetical protein